MIEAYSNQTATLYRRTGQDAYGRPMYDAGTPVKMRWEGRIKLIRDRTGKEVVSESRVFLREAIAAGDKFTYNDRDYIVLAVTEAVGLDGQIDHRVAYV